jgi:hypothetical protein
MAEKTDAELREVARKYAQDDLLRIELERAGISQATIAGAAVGIGILQITFWGFLGYGAYKWFTKSKKRRR